PVQYLNTRHRHLPVGEVKLSTEELLQTAAPAQPVAWSRTSLLALLAAREAVRMSGVDVNDGMRTGIISATTVGGMDRTENFYPQFMKASSAGRIREVVHHDCGASTELLADELNIRDWLTTINTACSSSVNAIMLGVRMI